MDKELLTVGMITREAVRLFATGKYPWQEMAAARIGPPRTDWRGYGEIRTAMPFVDVLAYSHYPKHGNVAERPDD